MAGRADALRERCAACGFEWQQLSTTGAAATARSLGRRWRELFERALAGDGDAVHHRLPGGWSVVGHAARVTDVLEREAVALAAIRDHHRPILRAADIEAPRASDAAADAADVVGDIGGAAELFARTAETMSSDDWLRRGVLAGVDVTAVDLALHALHEAAHQLHAAAVGIGEAAPRAGNS